MDNCFINFLVSKFDDYLKQIVESFISGALSGLEKQVTKLNYKLSKGEPLSLGSMNLVGAPTAS